MKFQHFVITRFCCKTYLSGTDRKLAPLDPDNITKRFQLLEMICLPAVMSQTNQNFIWVILVDPELKDEHLAHLEKLVLNRPNTVLHQCPSSIEFLSLNWLSPYIEEKVDYILTSNIDDDDTAPIGFVDHLHQLISAQSGSNQLPVMKAYGFSEILNWDIISSDGAPFGNISPWHRETKVSSCGFSFLCKYPQYDFNVMGIDHWYAMEILAFSGYNSFVRAAQVEQKMLQALKDNNEDMSKWEEQTQFVDLSNKLGPVVMSNHLFNAQETRLVEKKQKYMPVRGKEAFGKCPVDWKKIEDNMRHFRIEDTLSEIQKRYPNESVGVRRS